jgi:1-acyl-sn-glycerol-3-phosphate acyltransferase
VGALYSVTSRLFELGFRVAGIDLAVEGAEHVPSEGPAIIASNHVGYVDFAFVMLGPPRPRREMAFLARADLFERRLVGSALHALGQIPVDAHGDPAAAMRAAVERLEQGGLVGLHPEGTINPAFLPVRGRSGAVRLAQLTGAPIVPAAVWGSQRLLTKWRPAAWPERGIPVRVAYGAPFHPASRQESSAAEATRDLIGRIGVLVDRLIAEEGAPAGAWWVPAARGGGAPRPEEVAARLEAQVRERRERRLGRGTGGDGARP